MTQLPLGVGLPGTLSLENFLAGANAEALGAVQDFCNGRGARLLYLWGPAGSGKTHLTRAACRYLGARAEVVYVPLAHTEPVPPPVFDNPEGVAALGLDDLQAVVGRRQWELALFRLYNETERSGTRLLLTARANPQALAFGLEDLRSRLSSGLVIQLKPLTEPEREAVFRFRARERGFDIPPDVVDYLMRRYPRGMHELMALLDSLDHSTLAAGRRVTIPFVKSVLYGR